MIPLSLREIARLCPGKLEAAPGAAEATGVQIDSRRIGPGDLFVAVRGGTEFVADALEHGAAAALVPDDAFAALAALGNAVRRQASARVVGITGSVGKTSTKDILSALCVPHARTIAAEASYNAELGVPLTLCRLEAATEICILELAMRGFGQIAELCEIAEPELGVITSVAPVHLEFVGSLEGVARAKAELLHALPDGSTAVVPAGVPELEPLLEERLDIVRFGPGGEVTLERFEPPRLVARVNGKRVELAVEFTSAHQAANTLPALAAYHALGLPLEDAGRGAGHIEFSRLRGEEIELPGGGTLINDCWNANPISMKAALSNLVTRAQGRRTVAVLGDMAELGPEAEAYHREVGEAATEVDLVIAIGPLARDYGGIWAETVEDGIRELEARLEPGDTVLVKGSRAMGLEAVGEALAAVKTA